MRDARAIETTLVDCAGSAVFGPKKGGTLRFSAEYKRLNVVAVRDFYPTLHMSKCIHSLCNAALFTTLYCNRKSWQIKTEQADGIKTTPESHSGIFRFTPMPFALENDLFILQRAIDVLVSRVQWKTALEYPTVGIVYSKTVTEPRKHVGEVLHFLRTAKVTLKLAKCVSFDIFLFRLDYAISPGQLEVDTRNLAVFERSAASTNQTRPGTFLGICSVYRRLVPAFAKIAGSLIKKTAKGEPLEVELLTDLELKAFRDLKEKLASPPILPQCLHGYKCTLDTDTKKHQVGCALV